MHKENAYTLHDVQIWRRGDVVVLRVGAEELTITPENASALSEALRTCASGPAEERPLPEVMLGTSPSLNTIGHKDGYVVWQTSGNDEIEAAFHVFPPDMARALARQLLLSADRAEGAASS